LVYVFIIGRKGEEKLMKKERGKILVVLVAVMLILSCIPSGMAFAEGTTPTPTIVTPVYATNTSVSGKAVRNAGISLTVNGGTAQTTTAGARGDWTVTSLTLADGDSISVTAQVTGDTVSQAATATVQAAPVQTPTPTITTPVYATNTSVSGTAVDNAGISLTVNGRTAQATTADSSGNWTVTGPTLATGDSISVTAQVGGDTVSQAATATVQAAPVQTPTLTITTPIYAGATSVSGTAIAGADIELTVNSGTAQAATANSSGNWTVSALSALQTNDSISVTAQVTGNTVSAAATATVQAATVQTPTPTITTPIYAGATSVSGTATAGADIELTVNSGTAQAATANSSGSWTVSALSALRTNGSISVTAKVGGDMVSQAATATVEAALTAPTAPVFSDVSASYWGYDAISSLSSRGIVSGYPDGTFKPDASITRAEFATMLVKASGLNTSGTTGTFTDVTAGAWYYGSVNAAASAGLVSGMGDNLFAPNALVTREQMAVMVAKALGNKAPATNGTELNAFSDKSAVSSWAVSGMDEAVKAGIVSGMTADTLAPMANATRAQAAAMIYKMLAFLGK
jgi:hypothetical protein